MKGLEKKKKFCGFLGTVYHLGKISTRLGDWDKNKILKDTDDWGLQLRVSSEF